MIRPRTNGIPHYSFPDGKTCEGSLAVCSVRSLLWNKKSKYVDVYMAFGLICIVHSRHVFRTFPLIDQRPVVRPTQCSPHGSRYKSLFLLKWSSIYRYIYSIAAVNGPTCTKQTATKVQPVSRPNELSVLSARVHAGASYVRLST